MLRGYVDTVSVTSIIGWVVDDDAPDAPARVAAFVENELIGEVEAFFERPDLQEIGPGARGFQIELQTPLLLAEQLVLLRFEVNGRLWAVSRADAEDDPTPPFRLGPVYLAEGAVVVEVERLDPSWTGAWPAVEVLPADVDVLVDVRTVRDGEVERSRVSLRAGYDVASVVTVSVAKLTVFENVRLEPSAEASTGAGAVTELGPAFIRGWLATPDELWVEIDGEVIGSTRATPGHDAGGATFAFPIPRRFKDGRRHTVTVRQGHVDAPLPGALDGFEVGEHRLALSRRPEGLLASLDGPPGAETDAVEVRLTADGKSVAHVLAPLTRTANGGVRGGALFGMAVLAAHVGARLRVVCPAWSVEAKVDAFDASMVGELEGNLDVFDGRTAFGWCSYSLQPARTVILDAYLGDVLIGEVVANENRPDLADAGRTETRHGFRLKAPARMLDGRERQLVLRDRVLGRALPGTPRLVTLARDAWRSRSRPPSSLLRGTSTSAPVNGTARARSAAPAEVTIVILTRDGAEVLDPALESIWWHVPSERVRIVVVDHGSADGTRAVIDRWSRQLTIKHVVLPGNNSFAYGNNAAVRDHVETPCVMLLNNDVLLAGDVVGPMLETLARDPGAGVVGCKLIEARDPHDIGGGSVHHAGIQLGVGSDGVVRGYEAGPEMPVAEANRVIRPFAVTGACLMMRTRDYLEIGGLEESYFYDGEDVELGERVRARLGKEVVCLNGVVALHHRGWYRMSTRANDLAERMDRSDGLLRRRVGHQMKKRRQQALYTPGLDWSLGKGVVGLVVLEAGALEPRDAGGAVAQLARALEGEALLQAVYIDPETDWYDASGLTCLVNTQPEYDLEAIFNRAADLMLAAWLLGDIDAWLARPLERYDLIFCPSEDALARVTAQGLRARLLIPGDEAQASAAAFREGLESRFGVARVAIKIGAPNESAAVRWGDTYLAQDLAARLRRLGVRVDIHPVNRWHDGREHVDAAIVMRGLSRYQARPEDLNLLWVISHPDGVSRDELREYDKVAFGSQTLLDRYGDLDGRALLVRQGASTPPVAPSLSDAQRRLLERVSLDDVLVVGNTRGVRREFILAIQALTPVKFIGAGWDQYVSAEHILADFVNNAALPAFYKRALVVLNDHWPDMAEAGVVSNRIADVLASGGLVFSDWNAEGAALLGDDIFFREPEEVVQAIERLRRDPRKRGEWVERLAARAAETLSSQAGAEALMAALNAAHQRRFAGWAPMA